MAAPPEVTLKNLSGKWTMNKKLSDDTDRVLELQGVSWFMRRAISLASVTLTIKQYESDGITHIDCTQVATGGITSTENRTLDWQLRDDTDKVFGEVKGKSRWVSLKDVEDDDYLKTGYDDLEGEHVQAWTEGRKGNWTANQIWGFEMIQGKRYYVRHTIARDTKKGDWKEARLVYNWEP